jgi:hypothetical protein
VAASGVDLRIFERGYGFGTGVFGWDVSWLKGCSVVSARRELDSAI